ADSREVTVEYDINTAPDVTHPLFIGIYRSADDRFDAGDIAVGGATIAGPGPGQGPPTLDLLGQPAAAPGHHRVTIPLQDGLPPNPRHPYVLAVADPADVLALGSLGSTSTASFRIHVIGVITHGGLQDKNAKHAPWWELGMARALRRQGYD